MQPPQHRSFSTRGERGLLKQSTGFAIRHLRLKPPVAEVFGEESLDVEQDGAGLSQSADCGGPHLRVAPVPDRNDDGVVGRGFQRPGEQGYAIFAFGFAGAGPWVVDVDGGVELFQLVDDIDDFRIPQVRAILLERRPITKMRLPLTGKPRFIIRRATRPAA